MKNFLIENYKNPIQDYKCFKNLTSTELEFLGIYRYHNFLFKAPPDMGLRIKQESYEREEIDMILSEIPHTIFKDLNILEIGGCLGVVSVISNDVLKHKENHVVIEANPELIPILEFIGSLDFQRHRQWHSVLAVVGGVAVCVGCAEPRTC